MLWLVLELRLCRIFLNVCCKITNSGLDLSVISIFSLYSGLIPLLFFCYANITFSCLTWHVLLNINVQLKSVTVLIDLVFF